MNWVSIGSGNCLSPLRRQAISWQCWLIVNCTLRKKISEIRIKIKNNLFHENAFENIVCEMPFCPGRNGFRYSISLDTCFFVYGIYMSVEKYARILCQYHDFLLMSLPLMLPRHQLPRCWICRFSDVFRPPWTLWRHQIEAFSGFLAFCAGYSLVTGDFTRASDEEPWCFLWAVPVQTAGQAIETPVIRGHCAHYDVTVMANVPLQVIDVKWQIMFDR